MFKPRKRPAQDAAGAGGKTPRLTKALMYSQRRYVFSRADPVHDKQKPWAALGAWFLGPKAENGDVFRDLTTQAINTHIRFRQTCVNLISVFLVFFLIEKKYNQSLSNVSFFSCFLFEGTFQVTLHT